jgi:hypothetical protein
MTRKDANMKRHEYEHENTRIIYDTKRHEPEFIFSVI